MAHRQVWVKVNARVDEGMAEIIRLLNTIPGLQTLDSCQGELNGRPAHVFFTYGDWRRLGAFVFDKLAPRLDAVPGETAATIEMFNGSLPTGRLSFNAEATPLVASALKDLLTNDHSYVSAGGTLDTVPRS